MPGAEKLPGAARSQLPAWEYISGETLTNPVNTALTIPSTCSIIEIDAEDGKCYYDLNNPIASASSPGYVPADSGRLLGPIATLTMVQVHAPSAIVHVMYWRET